MIGYASSQDNSGSCANISIAVFFADDFAYTHDDYPDEIYHVNRKSGVVTKVFPPVDNALGVRHNLLTNIATMLHIEEIKASFATRITWRAIGKTAAELIKVSPLSDVWLPTPVVNENCKSKCINITPRLFGSAPKPLEASIVCDMLNNLLHRCNIRVSDTFYNCHNSVFCSEEVIQLLQALKSVEYEPLPNTSFDGNSLSFFVNAKRDCLSKILAAFSYCIANKSGIDTFVTQLTLCTKELIFRFVALSELFVLGQTIDSSQDIYYLTMYQLQKAFAFPEERLSLKTVVRHSRERVRILNKMNIPDTIYPDNI